MQQEKHYYQKKCLPEGLVYIKSNLIDTDNGMYFTVGSLIEINNIINGSSNIPLIKINVKP